MRFFKRLALSFAFMTRIPISIKFETKEKDIAKMVVFFPFTSLFVGLFMYLFFYLFGLLGFEFLPIIAALIAGVMITGALHIDGFIDCADAFFVSKDKKKALEILKDSRVGACGVVACVFLFAVKFLLLLELNVFSLSYLFIFLAMPVAGKIPILVCAYFSKYPREKGTGKSVITLSKIGEILIAVIMSALFLWLMFRFKGLIIAAVLIALGFIYVWVGKVKIGGATGDLLGSANETGEIIFLAAIFILVKFGG